MFGVRAIAVLGSVEAQERLRARHGHEPDARKNLAAYLEQEFARGEPWKLSDTRRSSATGLELSDRLVSRLEIANAVRWLPYRQRRILELRFVEDGLTVEETCRRLNLKKTCYYSQLDKALGAMVAVIYEWTVDHDDPSK